MINEYCPICGQKMVKESHKCSKKILNQINAENYDDDLDTIDEEPTFDDKLSDYESMVDPDYDNEEPTDEDLLDDGFSLI